MKLYSLRDFYRLESFYIEILLLIWKFRDVKKGNAVVEEGCFVCQIKDSAVLLLLINLTQARIISEKGTIIEKNPSICVAFS